MDTLKSELLDPVGNERKELRREGGARAAAQFSTDIVDERRGLGDFPTEPDGGGGTNDERRLRLTASPTITLALPNASSREAFMEFRFSIFKLCF